MAANSTVAKPQSESNSQWRGDDGSNCMPKRRKTKLGTIMWIRKMKYARMPSRCSSLLVVILKIGPLSSVSAINKAVA